MKPPTVLRVTAILAALQLGPSCCAEDDTVTKADSDKPKPQKYAQYTDYNQYSNYGENSYGNNDYDYMAGEDSYSITDRETGINCYSCTYDYRPSIHIQGEPACADPFDPFKIPSVECEGPCFKRIYWYGQDQSKVSNDDSETNSVVEYVISRGCLKNCQAAKDDLVTTECCSSSLCNASHSTLASASYLTILLCAFLTMQSVAHLAR